MSWEDRLELARSRREAVLKSRGPETAPQKPAFSKRKAPDAADLEPTPLVDETSEEDMKRAVSAAAAYRASSNKDSFAERLIQSRGLFIGMVFLAGIGIGALLILAAGMVLDRAPTTLANVPAIQSDGVGPAFDMPAVASRSPVQPALAPTPPEGLTVTSATGNESSLSFEPIDGELPGISSKTRRQYVKSAAFFPQDTDRLPFVGEAEVQRIQVALSDVAPLVLSNTLGSELLGAPDTEVFNFQTAALERPETIAMVGPVPATAIDALPFIEAAAEPPIRILQAPVLMRVAPPQRPFSLDPEQATIDQVRLVSAGSDLINLLAARKGQSDAYRRLVLSDTVEAVGLPFISVALGTEVLVLANAPLDFAAQARQSVETGFQVAALGSDLFARDVPSRLPLEFALIEPPATDLEPPKPILPGAEGLTVSIFAASTVEDDTVATTQDVVGFYELPVRKITRVGYRISQNQIRFYDASSAVAAERLAAEIGAISRDFTNSNANPPPGTLEVYLAGDAAPTQRQPSEAERLRSSVISKLRSGVFN